MKFKIKPLKWDRLPDQCGCPVVWTARPVAGPGYTLEYWKHTKIIEARVYSNGVSLKLGEWPGGEEWNIDRERAVQACNDHWRGHAAWIVESIAEAGDE